MTGRQSSASNAWESGPPCGHVGETLPDLPGLVDALSESGGTFLEIGGGYGVRLRRLVDEGALRRYRTVVLTDLDEQRVLQAKEYVPEAEAIACDAEMLPFSDASIDFVFSDQVIEHVTNDDRMTAEIYRVLRAGGRAYVGSVLKRPWAWYFYRNGGRWRLEPTHVREYASLEDFRRVFSDVGLSISAVWTVPMKFPLGESILRMLVRAGVVPADRFYEVHRSSLLLRSLSRVRLTIPGYFGCWALLRK
jgi:ubiquinone/menaquinone biosynthesis C-methylase UbiE